MSARSPGSTDAGTPWFTEFRDDRFTAAFDRGSDDAPVYTVAYVVRAVSPGSYVLPQARVEDMYRPDRFGRTGTGDVDGEVGEMRSSEQMSPRHVWGEVARLSPHWGEGALGPALHGLAIARGVDCRDDRRRNRRAVPGDRARATRRDIEVSTIVVDRDGKLFRPYVTTDGRGGCRRRATTSIRAISRRCSLTRTSASGTIAVSIRSR